MRLRACSVFTSPWSGDDEDEDPQSAGESSNGDSATKVTPIKEEKTPPTGTSKQPNKPRKAHPAESRGGEENSIQWNLSRLRKREAPENLQTPIPKKRSKATAKLSAPETPAEPVAVLFCVCRKPTLLDGREMILCEVRAVVALWRGRVARFPRQPFVHVCVPRSARIGSTTTVWR